MKIKNRKSCHVASVRQLGYLICLCLTLAAAPAQAIAILVLGDSLSAGYGIRQNDAWPNLLSGKLQTNPTLAGKNLRVINASISGETTAGGRHRLPALLRQHRPDIVIVELGANDGLRGLPLASMKDNLAGMLAEIKTSGARAILVGMRLPPNYGTYARNFQQTFADIARQTETPYVPFLLQGLSQSPEHFQSDGLHPTREAQSIVLENVWPTLQPLLR